MLIVRWLVINRGVDAFGRTMESRRVEGTLARFLKSLVGIGFKALLIISVASMVGIGDFIEAQGVTGTVDEIQIFDT